MNEEQKRLFEINNQKENQQNVLEKIKELKRENRKLNDNIDKLKDDNRTLNEWIEKMDEQMGMELKVYIEKKKELDQQMLGLNQKFQQILNQNGLHLDEQIIYNGLKLDSLNMELVSAYNCIKNTEYGEVKVMEMQYSNIIS